MCEYCEDIKNKKTIMYNRPIDSSLLVDGKNRRMIWKTNGIVDGTLIAYCEINYCPMCGRKLSFTGEEK